MAYDNQYIVHRLELDSRERLVYNVQNLVYLILEKSHPTPGGNGVFCLYLR